MTENNCIFCDIILRKSKGYIIYENDYVCCFLDKYPINKGHVLVVSKKHYEEFVDVDAKTLQEVVHTAQKVTMVLEKILGTDGITIMQNNGVFKDVDHYHMHIVPRFINDGFSWVEPGFEVDEEYFLKFHSNLSNLLKE